MSSEDTSKSESSPPNNRKEYNKEVSSSESESDDEATGTIRCICNDDSDHGLMIQCEKCLVWQHSICVGIRGDKAVPKHYYCEICQLRTFKCLCNKNDVTGKVIQCSQCNTWQHIRCLGRSTRALPKPYKCPSCDPSVLTTNSLSKKPKKKRKGSSEFDFISSPSLREEMEEDYFIIFTRNLTKPKPSRDFRTLYLSFRSLLEKYFVKLIDDSMDEKYEAKDIVKGISIILDAEPEAVSRCFTELVSFIQSPSSSITPNITAVDKMPDPNKGWSIIKDNVYPSKIKRTPLPKSEITSCAKDTPKLCNNEECQCRQHRHECTSNCACGCSKNESGCRNRQIQNSKAVATSVAKFQNKWGLAVNEPVQTDEFICEYLGSVSEMESMDYRSLPLEERTFTLALPDLEICVDARKFGNSARFLRRSCKPNAEIRERFVNNQLRVGIFAKEDIPAESEITIDFDFPWKESVAKRECACGTSDCVVGAWAEHLKSAVKSVNNQLKALDLPMNGVEVAKRKPEPASPTEEPREVPMQGKIVNDLNKTLDLDKLSREERKIALLMKTIQKMEDRQNRKRKYKDRDSQGNKIQKTGDDGSTSETSSPPPVSLDSPMQISEPSKESSISSKSEVGDGAPPSNEGKDSLGKEKPLLASLPIPKVESSKVPEKKETIPSDQPVKRKGPGRPPKYPRPNGIAPSKAPTPTKSSTTNPIVKVAPKEPTKTEKSEKIEKPVSKPSTPKLEKAVVKPVTPKIEKPPVKVPEKPPPQLKKEELPKELNGRMKDESKSSPNPKKKLLRPNPLSNSRESISIPIKAATTTSIIPKKETVVSPTPPQEDPMKSPHLKLGKKWILEYMNQTQEKQQPPVPPASKSMETPSSEAIKPIKKKIFDSIKTQTIESEKNTQTNISMETSSSNVQSIPKNGTHKDDPMDIDVRRVISEDQPSIYNGTLDSRERLIEANGSPHPSLQSNPLLGIESASK